MTNINWSEIFQMLWDFVFQFIQFMSNIWSFLTTKITIGFNIARVDIPIIGDLINWFIDFLNTFSVTFTPLYAFSGATIITLLTLYLIKTFIPIA